MKLLIVARNERRGSFLIAAAALKTPTRNGYTAQGVNLTIGVFPSLRMPTRRDLTAPSRTGRLRGCRADI